MINRRTALKQGTGTLLGVATSSVLPALSAQAATTTVVDPSLPVDNGTTVTGTKSAATSRPVGAVAVPPVPALLSAAAQPKFVNALPNPLSLTNTFAPDKAGGTAYTLRLQQFNSNIGLVDPVTRLPLTTVLWGYAAGPVSALTSKPAQSATSPGRSFVVNSNSSITVTYVNELFTTAKTTTTVVVAGKTSTTTKVTTTPLQHPLPIDTTLMWANPGNIGGAAPVPLVAHRHGGDQVEKSDGLPDQWVTPNTTAQAQLVGPRLFSTPYTYANKQEAGHLWYHDHALGITRENVFMGLAGHYIIRDANETALKLPKVPYEIALVIQDRMYDTTGKLFYPSSDPTNPTAPAITHLPEFFGDFIIVNGTPWPKTTVEPRFYRLRLLNGSDSRFYDLQFKRASGIALTFYQIGTELGMLNAPVAMTNLLLAPGERADILVSFKGLLLNETVTVTNSANAPYPGGTAPTAGTVDQIMQFQVGLLLNILVPDITLPTNLRPKLGALPAPAAGAVSIPVPATAKVRKVMLFEGKDSLGRLQTMLGTVNPANLTPNPATDGTFFFNDPVTENIKLNSTEVWEIYNTTVDAHPIHLHLVNFRVLSRQGFSGTTLPKPMGTGGAYTGGYLTNVALTGTARAALPNEQGRKDTVVCYPGEVTRIMATFSTAGTYVWHCHILSHEDHEMMRPFVVA